MALGGSSPFWTLDECMVRLYNMPDYATARETAHRKLERAD